MSINNPPNPNVNKFNNLYWTNPDFAVYINQASTALSIINDNTSTIVFPTFVDNAGNQQLKIDNVGTPFTYNPSIGNLTAVTFTGNLNGNATSTTTATNATTATTSIGVNLNSTNDDFSCLIPFTKTNTATGNQLYYDNTGGALTLSYNPFTSILSAANFSGDLTGNATTATTADNSIQSSITSTTTSQEYFPTFVSASAGINTLRAGGALRYNPSTSTLTNTTFSGALNGNATTATTATTSVGVNLTSDNANGIFFIPFSKTSTATGNTLFIDNTTTALTYNPNTSNLTATTFTGALVGNSTTATTSVGVNLTSDNSVSNCFIPFSKTTTATGNTLFIDDATTPFFYNPSTSTLTATIFSGALSGNATTATTATSATSAIGVSLTNTNTAGTYYIPFSLTTAATGNTLYIDVSAPALTYNPSTNTLSASIFSGALTGNVTGNVTGDLNGNANSANYAPNAGFATSASNANFANFASNSAVATTAIGVNLISDNTDANYYIPFTKTNTATGNQLYYDDTNSTGSLLLYNPATCTLVAGTFQGTFQGDFQGNLVGNATTATTAGYATNSGSAIGVDLSDGNFGTSYYLVMSEFLSATGNPLYVDSSISPLTYNAFTSTLSATTFSGALNGNATTATTAASSTGVALTSSNTNGTYYIPYTKTTNATGNVLFIDNVTTPLSYNPSTSTLTSSIFSGSASTIALTSDDTAGTYYIPFSKTTTATGNTLFIDNTTTPLTYNPSTSNLSASTFTADSSLTVDGPITLNTAYVAATTGQLGYTLTSSFITPQISFVTLTSKNILQLTIPIGVWSISYNVQMNFSSSTVITSVSIGITTVSNGGPNSTLMLCNVANAAGVTLNDQNFSMSRILNISASTTYYLTGNFAFSGTAPVTDTSRTTYFSATRIA
jgi:hypothetical protein